MKILSVINLKGGVGKTATSCNLAYQLSQRGFPTLVIDLDGQANASRQLGVPMSYRGKTVKDVYIGQNGLKSSLGDVIYETDYENLYLAPSSFDFVGAEILLKNEPQISAEYRIRNSLEDVSERFEYVIIDCPPALGDFVVNAMVASTMIITPVNSDDGSLEGLSRVLAMRSQIRKSLRIDPKFRVLFTMWDHTRNCRDTKDELVKALPSEEIFQTHIRRSTAVPSSRYQPASKAAPKSKPVMDYHSLTEEVIMNV